MKKKKLKKVLRKLRKDVDYLETHMRVDAIAEMLFSDNTEKVAKLEAGLEELQNKLRSKIEELENELQSCKSGTWRKMAVTTDHVGTDNEQITDREWLRQLDKKTGDLEKTLAAEKAGGWGKEYFEILEKEIAELRSKIEGLDVSDEIELIRKERVSDGRKRGEKIAELEKHLEQRFKDANSAHDRITKLEVSHKKDAEAAALATNEVSLRLTNLENHVQQSDEQAAGLVVWAGETKPKLESIELWVEWAKGKVGEPPNPVPAFLRK